MRRKVLLTSVSNVAAGQTASIDLPVGRRYFAVYMLYKGNAAQATIDADITEVRVILNGKVQRRFSGADLNVIMATRGFAFQLGLIPILFAEPRRRTWQGEEGLAWGTKGVSTFRIEVDISGAAVAPTLTATAEVDDLNVPIGTIVKWYKEGFNSAGAQVVNITTLMKRDTYDAIHIRSALATAIKVTVDSLEIADLTRTLCDFYARRRGFVQQANTLSLIFADSDQVTDGLPMIRETQDGIIPVQDFRVDVTASGAGALPFVIERVGLPD